MSDPWALVSYLNTGLMVVVTVLDIAVLFSLFSRRRK